MNVLITGAGSGIGQGMAEGLARLGHRVWVSDYDADRAQAVAEAILASGGEALGFGLDVTSEDLEGEIQSILSSAGADAVDVLVNNAGLQHVAKLEEFPMDRWRHLVDVMLNGVAGLTQAVLPGMRAQGFGRIVNIGSIHSLVASPYKSAYVAAKHGLMGLSKVVALETADTDITINTLCPTYVKTPLVDQQIAAQAKAHGLSESEVIETIMLKPMPKGVFITFEELTGACAFLMSPEARNITGQAIIMDGGWTVT